MKITSFINLIIYTADIKVFLILKSKHSSVLRHKRAPLFSIFWNLRHPLLYFSLYVLVYNTCNANLQQNPLILYHKS